MAYCEIRPARHEDVDVIVSLILELARYERLEAQCQVSHERLTKELFGPNPVIHCVLAWEVDETRHTESPVGFALYFFNFSTFLTKRGLYLEDLFVQQTHRGKGYGRRLIQHLAQEAVKQDCGRFDWVVLDWNQPAIQFYEKIGATVLPDWRVCRVEGEALSKMAKGQ